MQLISTRIYPPNHESIRTKTRPQHRELRPLLFANSEWDGSLTSHRVIYEQGLWDGAYGLSSLSEKTSKSNHFQMPLQRQHFLLCYLKTLSGGPAGVWTHDLPHGTPPTEPTGRRRRLISNKRGWNKCFIKRNQEILLDLADFALQKQREDNLTVAIFRAWFNGSYTMAAKPMKSLELHSSIISSFELPFFVGDLSEIGRSRKSDVHQKI